MYKALQNQLSANEMNTLKLEQREWIKKRDEAAKKAADEYAGGSLEPYARVVKLAELTKERSYELVEKYME